MHVADRHRPGCRIRSTLALILLACLSIALGQQDIASTPSSAESVSSLAAVTTAAPNAVADLLMPPKLITPSPPPPADIISSPAPRVPIPAAVSVAGSAAAAPSEASVESAATVAAHTALRQKAESALHQEEAHAQLLRLILKTSEDAAKPTVAVPIAATTSGGSPATAPVPPAALLQPSAATNQASQVPQHSAAVPATTPVSASHAVAVDVAAPQSHSARDRAAPAPEMHEVADNLLHMLLNDAPASSPSGTHAVAALKAPYAAAPQTVLASNVAPPSASLPATVSTLPMAAPAATIPASNLARVLFRKPAQATATSSASASAPHATNEADEEEEEDEDEGATASIPQSVSRAVSAPSLLPIESTSIRLRIVKANVAFAESAAFRASFSAAMASALGVPAARFEVAQESLTSGGTATDGPVDIVLVIRAPSAADATATAQSSSASSAALSPSSSSAVTALHIITAATDANSTLVGALGRVGIALDTSFAPRLATDAEMVSMGASAADASRQPDVDYGWVIILGLCIGIVIIIVVLAWLAANYNFSCCSSDAEPNASHGSVEKRRRPRSAGNSSLLARSRARGAKDALAAVEAEAGAALVVGQPNEGVANEDGELAGEAIAQKLMFEAEPVKSAAS